MALRRLIEDVLVENETDWALIRGDEATSFNAVMDFSLRGDAGAKHREGRCSIGKSRGASSKGMSLAGL